LRRYAGSWGEFEGGHLLPATDRWRSSKRPGERLTTGGNVILLDEPANDLDIETLHNWENALEPFAGCAVLISHDRWFPRRLCAHILAFEGDSHVEWFEGAFEAYEEDKKRRLGADSLIPKRIKFQKFGR
jgi:hypothetical protein